MCQPDMWTRFGGFWLIRWAVKLFGVHNLLASYNAAWYPLRINLRVLR